MSALWSRDEVERATGGVASGIWDRISGLSIDTRSLQPGEMFVALKDRRDGHEFVADALSGGAAAALVSRRPEGVSEDAPLLLCSDTLDALEAMADAARKRARGAKTIAVTGSVGKTTVKEALRAALGEQGATHASERSFNNHWGVPLTLARMPSATRFGVFEIGMNHAGEIAPLTRMVRPHIAIVTTVAPAHLGNFAGERDIALAKAEILEGVQPGGAAMLNADNRWYALLAARAAALGIRVVTFGSAEDADIRLLRHVQQPESAAIEAEIFGEQVLFNLAAPGRPMALNALAVLGTAKLAGADLALAALALSHWQPGSGRGARKRVRLDPIDPDSAFTLIDESYNANPVSVAAALETLGLAEVAPRGSSGSGRRIAVLGDMLELGVDSDDLHAGLAEAPEMADVDCVFCCGHRMRALHEALPPDKRGGWAEDSSALVPLVRAALHSGDAVTVKGSLGSRMSVVVEALESLGRRRVRHADTR